MFTTATFIGYLLGGFRGAAVATLGIFLPAFVFVAVSGPLVPRLRRSPLAGALLDGVNVGALALMAVVTLFLARAAIVDVTTIDSRDCERVRLDSLSGELRVAGARRRLDWVADDDWR